MCVSLTQQGLFLTAMTASAFCFWGFSVKGLSACSQPDSKEAHTLTFNLHEAKFCLFTYIRIK